MKKTIAQELGVTKFPFEIKDDRGNVIYKEYDDGFWKRWEVDLKGRELYYQNSSSFWAKREYDDNGGEIYFENSDGYWAKREWDANGNLIYYQNSDGEIIDNRPKAQAEPMTIEIDGKKYKLTEI